MALVVVTEPADRGTGGEIRFWGVGTGNEYARSVRSELARTHSLTDKEQDMNQPVSLWTAEETAAYLSVTPAYLKYLRGKKEGPPYYKLGPKVRYHPRQVVRWLNRQMIHGETIGEE